MANTAQARKRARQSEKRRRLNASLRSMVRSAMKRAIKAVAAGDKAAAETAFRESTSVVDRIADKGRIIHKIGRAHV